MGIRSVVRSRVRRAGTASVLALALVAVPTAALAAGSKGGGVPASLRMHNTDGWWYTAMHLPAVQKHLSGAGVTVAIIDGSIDLKAPELQGASITLGRTCGGGVTKSRPVTSQIPDSAGGTHGTSMAAYLVGQGHGSGPAGSGILGVAPKAHLMYYSGTNRKGGSCGAAPLIRAAVDDGASIISMSFGGGFDDPSERSAVRYAESKGVVLVASSGDTGGSGGSPSVDYPAGDPGVVAVNAVNKAAKPWGRNPAPMEEPASQGAPAVNAFPVISAPGVHAGALLWFRSSGFWSTGYMNGTSPATAITAGALALVKQKYPTATGNQLIQDLIHNPGGTGYGWDAHYGFGIVSVPHMLAQDPTKWPDVNPLLNGPDAAVKNFPSKIYGHPAAAKVAQDQSASKASGKTSSAKAAGDTTGGAPSDGGGAPGWLWAVLAVIGVAVAGLGAKLGLSKRATG